MSAPKSHRYEHAALGVDDLEQALDFYTGVFGLKEIARDGDAVFLGCGYDDNFDLCVRPGGAALDSFALRMPDADALDAASARLSGAGVETSASTDPGPGIEAAIAFSAPTGHRLELVVVGDRRYHVPSAPAKLPAGLGPLDADHINLMAGDVKGLIDFLSSALGFRLSDAIEPEAGFWVAAWTRLGAAHHDVGVFFTESDKTLHHLAWTCASVEHMKMLADRLAAAGMRLELGLSRHPVGSNLYAYFWAPGGHRFELTAEGAILDDSTPPRTWKDMGETLDAWGTAIPPESMFVGS